MVIDSTDVDRLDTAKEELYRMLAHEVMREKNNNNNNNNQDRGREAE